MTVGIRLFLMLGAAALAGLLFALAIGGPSEASEARASSAGPQPAGAGQKLIGGNGLATPLIERREISLERFESDGATVACSRAGRVISGGAYFIDAQGNRDASDSVRLTSSTPTNGGRRWYASGTNLEQTTRVLRIWVKCVPKVRPQTGKVGSFQLADYEVETRSIPLTTGFFSGGTIECDGPGRLIVGGAAIKQDGSFAAAGELSGSSPDLSGDDNPRGWYGAGTSTTDGAPAELELTAMCLPDTTGEKVGSDDLVDFEQQEEKVSVPAVATGGAVSRCRPSAQPITGGAYIDYRSEGQSDIDPSSPGYLAGSAPSTESQGWYGAIGNDFEGGGQAVAVESYCLPDTERIGAAELAEPYVRLTNERMTQPFRDKVALARCKNGDRLIGGGAYMLRDGVPTDDGNLVDSLPRLSPGGRSGKDLYWYASGYKRPVGPGLVTLRAWARCLPKTERRATQGVGADDLAPFVLKRRTFNVAVDNVMGNANGGFANCGSRALPLTGGVKLPNPTPSADGNLAASGAYRIDVEQATGRWFGSGTMFENRPGTPSRVSVYALCLPRTEGTQVVGSDDLERLIVRSEQTPLDEDTLGATELRCDSPGSLALTGGTYFLNSDSEGIVDPTLRSILRASLPLPAIEGWYSRFASPEGFDATAIVNAYCLPR